MSRTTNVNQAAWAGAQKNGAIKILMDGEYVSAEEVEHAVAAGKRQALEFQLRVQNEKPKKARGRSKYNNKKTQVDSVWFDSQNESKRYLFLKRLASAGIITDFLFDKKALVTLALIERFSDRYGKKHQPTTWTPDFQYTFDGLAIIEDFKGYQTPDFRLKKKMIFRDFPHLHVWINPHITAMPTKEQFESRTAKAQKSK